MIRIYLSKTVVVTTNWFFGTQDVQNIGINLDLINEGSETEEITAIGHKFSRLFASRNYANVTSRIVLAPGEKIHGPFGIARQHLLRKGPLSKVRFFVETRSGKRYFSEKVTLRELGLM